MRPDTIRLLAILSLTSLVACTNTQEQTAPAETRLRPTIGGVERLDPALDAIVPADAVIEILSDGHEWTEGPLWVRELQSVLYSDIPNNAIYRWSEDDSSSVWLQPAGYTGDIPRGGESGSNGLILDEDGNLLLAQHGDRRIARMLAPLDDPAPVFETLVDSYDGRRFSSPNDLVLSSWGDLYFTDPPYGLEQGVNDPLRELDVYGVYRLRADGSLDLLTDELARPNGVAFSPDESILYASSTDGQNQPVVMAYDVQGDGSVTNGRVFFDTWGDGMAVDQAGNLYVAGPGNGVFVISPAGVHLGTIHTTQRTSNCTFGEDGSTLFITADMYLVRIRLNAKGVGF